MTFGHSAGVNVTGGLNGASGVGSGSHGGLSMRILHTIFVFAAALSIGTFLADVDPAHAQLGTGNAAIGGGGEAIGRGAPEGAASEAPRAVAPLGQCVTNRTAFRTPGNFVGTTSTSFALMPNTHFPVTHAAGCLIVDFAGTVLSSDASNAVTIRAFIVGIGPAEPGAVSMGRPAAPGIFETRSMRFVFRDLPAGTHTVRIEWQSNTGGNVNVAFRTLTVQYR